MLKLTVIFFLFLCCNRAFSSDKSSYEIPAKNTDANSNKNQLHTIPQSNLIVDKHDFEPETAGELLKCEFRLHETLPDDLLCKIRISKAVVFDSLYLRGNETNPKINFVKDENALEWTKQNILEQPMALRVNTDIANSEDIVVRFSINQRGKSLDEKFSVYLAAGDKAIRAATFNIAVTLLNPNPQRIYKK